MMRMTVSPALGAVAHPQLPPIWFAPVIAISAVCGLVLIAAWANFGRLRHALTWAIAFLLLSVMWGATALAGAGSPMLLVVPSIVGGVAVALGAIGFRQRAQMPLLAGRLIGLAGAQAAATILLALSGVARPLLSIPFYLQGLAMLIASGRVLRGRRRSERIAERGIGVAIVAAAAWLLIRIAQAAGTTDSGALALCAFADLIQPLVIMIVGLFVIFLIAADLADRMRRHAATDRLTGLLNRRGLDEALAAMLGSVRRNDRALAMIVADIDCFKSINDRFGHATGDAAICAFADCLNAGVARRDLVARIGGEEFAIVMADVAGEAARCAAEVLRQRAAALRLGTDGSLRITASFGVAPAADAATPAELLARADRALYRSKALGRNQVTVVH